MKHTPWIYKAFPMDMIENAAGDIICENLSYGRRGMSDEQHANARLIASAPALLAALKALHQANAETFDGLPTYDALWDAAAKAIQHAEGGTTS